MSFNAYAQSWDTDKRIKRAEKIAKKIYAELNQVIENTKACTALEFGCGTGLISFNLNQYFKRVNLVDTSSKMIEVLEEKIEHARTSNMFPYLLEDSIIDSFDEQVDIIYNSLVLHHIDDTEDQLNQFYKLLNQGGYLVIVDLDKEDGRFHLKYPEFDGHNGFDQQQLKTTVEKVGFKDVSIHTFYKDVKTVQNEVIDYSLFILVGRK